MKILRLCLYKTFNKEELKEGIETQILPNLLKNKLVDVNEFSRIAYKSNFFYINLDEIVRDLTCIFRLLFILWGSKGYIMRVRLTA